MKLTKQDKNRLRNKSYITRIKNMRKDFLNESDSSKQAEKYLEVARMVQKTCTKGIIKKNKASRIISRLHKKIRGTK